MVVADGPGNFPRAVLVLPQMNELAFTDALGFLLSRVVETMDAYLDRATALPVVCLERVGSQGDAQIGGCLGFSGKAGRTVWRDEKIFSEMHFFVACGDEACILRMRTHFSQRASENRLGGRE
jgi:hypothetical protein